MRLPGFTSKRYGTRRLYEDGFAFQDRRARFIPTKPPENLMEPTPDHPYVLITGRLLEHFNTGEMSRRSKKLMKTRSEAFLEINPDDAEQEKISEGERVQVTSPYGTAFLKAVISKSMLKGYLFAPIHFSKPNFNSLMSAVPIDPQARMPALKVVPVRINRSGS